MSRQTDKFNELQKKLHRCKRLKSLTHIQKVKKIDTIWEEQAKTADPDEFQSILQQYSNPHDTTQKDITSFFKPLQSFDKQRLNQWHRLNHNSPAPNTPSRKATQPKYNSPAPNTPSRKATPSRKYNTPKPMRRRQAASARKYQTPRQDKIASEIKSKRDNIAKEREFIRLLSTFRESDGRPRIEEYERGKDLLDDDSTKWMHYDESFSSKVEEYKAQMEEYNTTNKLDEHGFIVITADNYCDFYTHPLADMLTQYDSDEDVCDGLDKYHVDKNKSKRKNKRKRSRKQMLNDSGTDEELQGMQRKRRRIYFGPKTDKREMDHSEDDDDNKTDGSSDDDVPIELLSVPAVNGDKSDEGSSDDDVPIGGYLSKPAVNGNKTDESSSDDDEPII